MNTVINVGIPRGSSTGISNCAKQLVLPNETHCPDPGYIGDMAIFLSRIHKPSARIRIYLTDLYEHDPKAINKTSAFGEMYSGRSAFFPDFSSLLSDRLHPNIGHSMPRPRQSNVYLWKRYPPPVPSLSFPVLFNAPNGYWILLIALMAVIKAVEVIKSAYVRLVSDMTKETNETGTLITMKGFARLEMVGQLFYGIILAALSSFLFGIFSTDIKTPVLVSNDKQLYELLKTGHFRAITAMDSYWETVLVPERVNTQFDRDMLRIAGWNPPVLNDSKHVLHQFINRDAPGRYPRHIWIARLDELNEILHRFCDLDHAVGENSEVHPRVIYYSKLHSHRRSLERIGIPENELIMQISDHLKRKYYPKRADCAHRVTPDLLRLSLDQFTGLFYWFLAGMAVAIAVFTVPETLYCEQWLTTIRLWIQYVKLLQKYTA